MSAKVADSHESVLSDAFKMVALTPTAHAEPARLTRFSPRTVIMAIVALVALWTLLARMNLAQISDAVSQANIWWILGALVFSLATYVGAGLALVAFSPVRLSVWRSTEGFTFLNFYYAIFTHQFKCFGNFVTNFF